LLSSISISRGVWLLFKCGLWLVTLPDPPYEETCAYGVKSASCLIFTLCCCIVSFVIIWLTTIPSDVWVSSCFSKDYWLGIPSIPSSSERYSCSSTVSG
jgi:hypothetical protein